MREERHLETILQTGEVLAVPTEQRSDLTVVVKHWE